MPKAVHTLVNTTPIGMGRVLPSIIGTDPSSPYGLGVDKSIFGIDSSKKTKGAAKSSSGLGYGVYKARIELPEFTDIAIQTQLCFAYKFQIAGWPETGIRGPYVNAQEDCEPPSELEILEALVAVGTEGYWWVESKFAKRGEGQKKRYATWGANVAPTLEDMRLFGASIAFLQKNLDVVDWANKLVESWSDEIAGLQLAKLIEWLLSPDDAGRLPFGVTYVSSAYGLLAGSFELQPANATGWAFTCAIPTIDDQIGVIIPVRREDQPWMRSWLPAFEEGGARGLCAVIEVATMILHELVHIVGDLWDPREGDRMGSESSYDGDESNFYGTTHEQDDEEFLLGPDGEPTRTEDEEPVEDPDYVRYPCWDECRMVASLFQWGIAHRYPCLASKQDTPGDPWSPGGTGTGGIPKIEPKNGCENLGDPLHVALSFHPGN